ncbi:hypothetical protein AB0E16_19750, partial [Streptomyces sp. NPDC047970]
MPATPSRPTTAVRSAPPSFAPGAPALVPRLDAHGCEGRRTGGLRTGGDAGGAPGPSRRPPGPYRRLFGIPGTRAFTAAGLLARLPAGMAGGEETRRGGPARRESRAGAARVPRGRGSR